MLAARQDYAELVSAAARAGQEAVAGAVSMLEAEKRVRAIVDGAAPSHVEQASRAFHEAAVVLLASAMRPRRVGEHLAVQS